MNKLFLALSVLFLLNSCAEKKQENSTAAQSEHYKKVLDNALKMDDYNTAATAIHSLILLDTSNASLRDSLPVYYIKGRNYAAASKATDELLKRKPDDAKILEMKAIAEQELGNGAAVLQIYSQLYQSTKNLEYLYQLATIQVGMENYEGCLKTMDDVIKLSESRKDSIEIYSGENQNQLVPIRAAAYNFKGYVLGQLRQLPQANKMFRAALKEYPDFELAKRNLATFGG